MSCLKCYHLTDHGTSSSGWMLQSLFCLAGLTPRGMTPMITQNGQPTGQTPLRTPVRDKLNINQPEDMDPAMFENFEQVSFNSGILC